MEPTQSNASKYWNIIFFVLSLTLVYLVYSYVNLSQEVKKIDTKNQLVFSSEPAAGVLATGNAANTRIVTLKAISGTVESISGYSLMVKALIPDVQKVQAGTAGATIEATFRVLFSGTTRLTFTQSKDNVAFTPPLGVDTSKLTVKIGKSTSNAPVYPITTSNQITFDQIKVGDAVSVTADENIFGKTQFPALEITVMR